HLLLQYDTETRNVYRGLDGKLPEPGQVQNIRLQPLDQLDPATFTLLQGRQDTRLEQLKKAVRLLNQPLEDRPAHHPKLK
ncbi:MAG TPA: hypothetical protein VKQ52_20695, partial [Puia sp.]|nr:hypothetical protein [Puia sp.]